MERIPYQYSSLVIALFKHIFLEWHEYTAHGSLIEIAKSSARPKRIACIHGGQLLRVFVRIPGNVLINSRVRIFEKCKEVNFLVRSRRTEIGPSVVERFEGEVILSSLWMLRNAEQAFIGAGDC